MKTTIKPTAKFCLTANNAEGRQNAHDQSRLNKNGFRQNNQCRTNLRQTTNRLFFSCCLLGYFCIKLLNFSQH
ncbi:hypothetical protein DVP47_15585 [Yersinia enterocolitica]|nr:hypothetical protein [Yersinia enterocolitica]EKN6285247.1 hypothetical protein [Yersinia enterocolitica]EKN6291356.1 hypothetical protein [Yersinia enterocolitica]EKN6301004.1 hypothetical protein [Yersinia enterocolitica]EKN6305333.1 hypothetical protein [Yersinia enterocolitica]